MHNLLFKRSHFLSLGGGHSREAMMLIIRTAIGQEDAVDDWDDVSVAAERFVFLQLSSVFLFLTFHKEKVQKIELKIIWLIIIVHTVSFVKNWREKVQQLCVWYCKFEQEIPRVKSLKSQGTDFGSFKNKRIL